MESSQRLLCPPLAVPKLASGHPVGTHLSDGRVISVMLVLESPTSRFANRLSKLPFLSEGLV